MTWNLFEIHIQRKKVSMPYLDIFTTTFSLNSSYVAQYIIDTIAKKLWFSIKVQHFKDYFIN